MMHTQKESPTTGQAVGLNKSINSAAIIPQDEQKLFTTYAAKAALAGHQLTRTADGYMLSKWTHSRHCKDIQTVSVLLRAMGVKL